MLQTIGIVATAVFVLSLTFTAGFLLGVQVTTKSIHRQLHRASLARKLSRLP